MKRLFLILLMASVVLVPGYTQEDKEEPKKEETEAAENYVYREVILEDFENAEYTIDVPRASRRTGKVDLRMDKPPQAITSTKFLGVRTFGKSGDVFNIKPPAGKKLVIDKYCREIAIWVGGNGIAGELLFLLKDSDGNTHRVSFGLLNFNGWRKLTVPITSKFSQLEKHLARKRNMEVLYLQYKHRNTGDLMTHYFYLDNLSATVRDKYELPGPSNDW